MKKHIFNIALLLLLSIGAKAQFSLGVKGGLNISQLNRDNLSQSTTEGYQLGAWARIGNGFYLQPELYVGSKGGEIDFQTTGTNTGGSARVKFTTLDVPLLLGKSFGASHLNFRIMAGPIYSFYLSQDNTYSDNLAAAYRDLGNYKNSTLGYQAGAGVDIGNISFDARYEGSLNSVNDNYGQRPSLWHLSLGFKVL